jgi:hypothetical protein
MPDELSTRHGSPTSSPQYLTPTIEEIERYTVESGPEQDMADCLRDDPLATEMWEHLQSDLATARDLEGLVRNYRRSTATQWERFKNRRFDRRTERVVERERRRWNENEGTSERDSPIPLVIRNLTPPLAMILPGATSRPGNSNVEESRSSPSTSYGSEGEFRTIVENYEQTTIAQQERTRTTREIIEEQRDERRQEQAEQLQRNRTNARFGQLGVRRNPFRFRTLANRMRRGN